MSAPQFTSGPWKLVRNARPGYGSNLPGCEFAIVQEGEFGVQVATVMTDMGAESDANAALLVAAPDLHRALETIVAHVGWREDDVSRYVASLASAALAMARGGAE